MWRIEISKKAEKEFSKLDYQSQREIKKYLDKLLEGQDPYRFGKALVGDLSGFWRYRVGKYRLICEIQKNVLIIEIISIARRDKIYN